jgi:hypothetical protein
MSKELTGLLIISVVGLLLAVGLRAQRTREWGSFLLGAGALSVFGIFLYLLFGFPVPQTGVLAKGPGDDLTLAAALYVCMLCGMFSQYLYRLLERPRSTRPKWDWGLFLAPIFASPIVFIPLFAAFQGAGIDLKQLTTPRLMVFFVAFQNGFFWKEFFDRKRRQERSQK